jgi:hypothetical protein
LVIQLLQDFKKKWKEFSELMMKLFDKNNKAYKALKSKKPNLSRTSKHRSVRREKSIDFKRMNFWAFDRYEYFEYKGCWYKILIDDIDEFYSKITDKGERRLVQINELYGFDFSLVETKFLSPAFKELLFESSFDNIRNDIYSLNTKEFTNCTVANLLHLHPDLAFVFQACSPGGYYYNRILADNKKEFNSLCYWSKCFIDITLFYIKENRIIQKLQSGFDSLLGKITSFHKEHGNEDFFEPLHFSSSESEYIILDIVLSVIPYINKIVLINSDITKENSSFYLSVFIYYANYWCISNQIFHFLGVEDDSRTNILEIYQKRIIDKPFMPLEKKVKLDESDIGSIAHHLFRCYSKYQHFMILKTRSIIDEHSDQIDKTLQQIVIGFRKQCL